MTARPVTRSMNMLAKYMDEHDDGSTLLLHDTPSDMAAHLLDTYPLYQALKIATNMGLGATNEPSVAQTPLAVAATLALAAETWGPSSARVHSPEDFFGAGLPRAFWRDVHADVVRRIKRGQGRR